MRLKNCPARTDPAATAKRQPSGLNGGRKVDYLPRGARHHHHVAELFALDTRLPLKPEAARVDVPAALEGHVIANCHYTGARQWL